MDEAELPPIETVTGTTIINTHLNEDGTVNILLENVDPAHIQALYKEPFSHSVEAAVWAHAEIAAKAKQADDG